MELVVLATNAAAVLETSRGLLARIAGAERGERAPLGRAGVAGRAPRGRRRRAGRRRAALARAGKLSGEPPDEDAFVCGDDADAKAMALDLAQKLVRGRAVDAGPLARRVGSRR